MALTGPHPMGSELREAESEGWDLCEITPPPRPTIETTNPQSRRAPSRQELFGFQTIDGRTCGLVPQDRALSSPTPGLEACLDAMRHAQQVVFDDPSTSHRGIEARLRDFTQRNATDSALPRSLHLAFESCYPWPSSPATTPVETGAAFDELPYFVYGASMFPAMLARLELDVASRNSEQQAGRKEGLGFRLCPAVLPGFVLHALQRKPYPACVVRSDQDNQHGWLGDNKHDDNDMLAEGMLLHLPKGPGSLSLRMSLHALQNKDYALRRVKVFAAGTQSPVYVEAYTYVFRGDPSQLISRRSRRWQVQDLLDHPWFQGIASAEEVKLLEQQWIENVEEEVEWPRRT